jgi:hypothetical protein
MVAAWLVAGALLVSQVRLPDVPAARPSGQPASADTCWAVSVVTGPTAAPVLRRSLRRLWSAGLPATLRPGHRTGTRIVVVPASSRGAARTVQLRVKRLGFRHTSIRRLPTTARRAVNGGAGPLRPGCSTGRSSATR